MRAAIDRGNRATRPQTVRLRAARRPARLAARSGSLHATVLFTGFARAGMRGEMRSRQVLGAP